MILQFEKELNIAKRKIGTLREESKTVSDYEAKKEVLRQLHEATILTERDWHEFVDLFEKVYPKFINRLQQDYPNLTTSEIRFIVLSKLKLGNKEMALMLGVGTSAIRQYKKRVRDKVNPKHSDIEEFIRSF